MKKVVVESIYELRELESLNEQEINEFNLADFAKKVKGAVSSADGKAALEVFLKNIQGKTEVPDETVNKAFRDTFTYTFNKHKDYIEKTGKLPLARKMELMQTAAKVMKAEPNKDTPILVWNDPKKVWQAGAIGTSQASGTHGQATPPQAPKKPAAPAAPTA